MSNHNPPQLPRTAFISPAGLAAYLGLPLPTIYTWRHKGDGPPGVKLGRHVRYRLSDVDQWIEDQGECK